MFIDIALQDEFINMDFSKQMVLDNKTLKERARLILPKNYRELINKHEDKHRIQKIWQTLLEGFIYELSSKKSIHTTKAIDIAMKGLRTYLKYLCCCNFLKNIHRF